MKNLIQKALKIYKKHEEVINYLIIGGLTTVIGIGTYYLFANTFLDIKDPIQLQIANVLSWICAVIFAYFTNRIFVFKSKSKKYIKEVTSFVISRIATLFSDMLIMFLLVTIITMDDLIAKIISQVIVIVLNYIFSKLFVFKK